MIETLGDIIRDNAYKLGRDTAFVHQGRAVSFGEYYQRALRLAHALWQRGLRRQSRIAVMSKNSAEFLEVYGASEMAGYAVATINFRLTAPEVDHILSDSQPMLVVFDIEHHAIFETLRGKLPETTQLVCIGGRLDWADDYEAVLCGGACEETPFRAQRDDMMHLIYTSGTTGRPKGVIRTHAGEIDGIGLMTTEVGVLRQDVVQIMMPLYHIGARWLQLGAHLRGAPVILHREFDPAEILATIEKHRVTITHMAPTIVQRVLDHPAIDLVNLSSLKTIYYSAAPMPLPLLERGLERLGSVFVQLYGMTEGMGTTLHREQHRPKGTREDVARLKSVGQSPSGIRIRICDDDGNPLPALSPGEVVLHTSTRMQGYWNNSVATGEVLKDGWYHSGDMGYLDEEGFLFLVDRKKDMIISGGENIYCREVEEVIASHPGVLDVAVIGIPHDEWGEVVGAIVVAQPSGSISTEDLITHCNLSLAGYKRPRVVHFVEELPRLTTGKIDKVSLRKRWR